MYSYMYYIYTHTFIQKYLLICDKDCLLLSSEIKELQATFELLKYQLNGKYKMCSTKIVECW